MSDATDRYQELAGGWVSNAARDLTGAWIRFHEAERAETWRTFIRDMVRAGLPSCSGPIGGSHGSGDRPMPQFDDIDRTYLKWCAERVEAEFFTTRFKKWYPHAQQRLGRNGNDQRGKNLADLCNSASKAAVRHLDVMVVVMGTVRPLALEDAQKLTEEEKGPACARCGLNVPGRGRSDERLYPGNEGRVCFACYRKGTSSVA